MYRLTNTDTIVRLSDNAHIPMVGGNRDYREYLEWVDAGNTPEPYVEPPVPVPTVVSMRQARLALLQANLLTTVNNVVESMVGPEGEAARIEWEYAVTVERDSALVTSLGGALGMTEEQMDDLFTVAASL